MGFLKNRMFITTQNMQVQSQHAMISII